MRNIEISGELFSFTNHQYLALWKILENIINHPGIDHDLLIEDASSFALRHSRIEYFLYYIKYNKLWEASKFGSDLNFCYYPNDLTLSVFRKMEGPVDVFTEIVKENLFEILKSRKHGDVIKITPGDLVVHSDIYQGDCLAIFTEFSAAARPGFELTAPCFNDLKCPITPKFNQDNIKRFCQYNHYNNVYAHILCDEKKIKTGLTMIKKYEN
jgi:hypothetical protein